MRKWAKRKKTLREDYDNESEDGYEALGVKSEFNILNSSLRNTYHSRPALSMGLETPENVKIQGVEQQQAFAPGAVIAAAAKAARKKKQIRESKLVFTSENISPVSESKLVHVETTISEDNLVNGDHDAQKLQAEKPAENTGKTNWPAPKTENPGHKRIRGSDKQEKESLAASAEAVHFSDLGGMDGALDTIREITFPLYNPDIYSWLGLQPVGGVLLHGPPGCGKTKLANAIGFETGLPFLKISAPEVVSGMSGESEAKIRGLFAEAQRLAPCIIFIDEIDAITSKRESASREMERRIVTQLMTCMDDLNESFWKTNYRNSEPKTARKGHVLVIGATNRPEALDPALRRPGRLDREILLGIPDENGRAQILSVLTKHLRLEGSFDLKYIAKCTPGFVGADLVALTREAGSVAIKRIVFNREMEGHIFGKLSSTSEGRVINTIEIADSRWKVPWTEEEILNLSITMKDFEDAMRVVQPSTKREGFSAIPDVKWEDVGALDHIQKEMQFFVSRRIKHPEDYEALGLEMDTGFLLYGPPGCGKTLVAKALANDAQANFIFIKGPELLNKYVGESELAVRALFSRARSCTPCILFFDEIDALAPRRGTDGNAVAERVLNQLLSEMDGAEKRRGVFIIGATNRPDMIDSAVLRPGRLGKLLFVPLPDSAGRLSILKTLTRQKPIASDVNLASIAANKSCEGLSGADLSALVNEACFAALQERSASDNQITSGETDEPLLVTSRHFDIALSQIFPSVSKQDLLYYEALPKKLNRIPGMKGISSELYS